VAHPSALPGDYRSDIPEAPFSFSWSMMTLTPSEVASLTNTLSHWELAEYISCGLVTIACVGEFIADFTDWFTGGNKEKKDRLAKLSTLLLITSLAFELICLVRTNQISGKVIGSLDEKAEEASNKSERAITDADSATDKARTAKEESDNAKAEAGKARDSASKAESLAHDARQEADSFEKDIVSAKNQASSAESHLAEALQRAAEATAALDRLKSPRSLTNTPGLISALAAFKDTEYTFSSVSADEESIRLLKSVNDVLQQAGWKRTKPPGGFPAINIFGTDDPFAVPAALTNGIRISVDWPEGLSALQALPLDKLPMLVKAAVSLNVALSSGLSPQEDTEHPHPVDIVKGESKTVRISIGKKP